MPNKPYPKIPQVPAAGWGIPQEGETTKRCLTFEQRPTTPHEIKKYRTSFHNIPGTRVVHPGLIDDIMKMNGSRAKLHPELQVFGITSRNSDHVTDIFKEAETGPVRDQIDAQKESVYKSTNLEPLGRSMIRGHVLPQQVSKSDFAFGLKKKKVDPDAKDLIAPATEYDDTCHDQYVKSHGAYHPGEQKDLGYKWPGIDPHTHRFGKVEKIKLPNGVGAKHCLKPTEDPERVINNITNKRVEDKKMTSDKLGMCKNLGLGEREPPKNGIFGVQKISKDDWGAGDCINGDYTEAQQMPDQDLGQSVTVGWRNLSKTDRAYGCPSVRKDVPIPSLRSIADNQNYGDDPSASGLLYPSRFQHRGVTDADFVKVRAKEELRGIFSNIGHSFSDEVFEGLYNLADESNITTPAGCVSIEDFRQIMNAYYDSQK